MSEKPNIFHFDERLLGFIASYRNDEAKAMLNKDLCRVADDFGTLLHYAANYQNVVIIRHLIELGRDVDSQQSELSETPIMMAMDMNSAEAVKVLLEFGANIDITNAEGKSALQLAFAVDDFDAEIVQAFFDRLRSENLSTEDFVERLMLAECPLYHAAYLRDIKVMEIMLTRGIDVDSESYDGKTALHAAVELDDVQLVSMLINKNADVNALDEDGASVLFLAASNGKSEIVGLLLQECAFPNVKEHDTGHTPLYQVYINATVETQENFYKCAVLLLRHGAKIPGIILFDRAISNGCYDLVHLLIAHLAMLETMISRPLPEGLLFKNWEQRYKNPRYDDYYQNCNKILRTSLAGGKLTILDFFKYQDRKMRICMRNQGLIKEIANVYTECRLSEDYPYYFEIISERVTHATKMVKFEKLSIALLTEIFSDCFGHLKGECFVVAEQVVGYLNDYYVDELCGA